MECLTWSPAQTGADAKPSPEELLVAFDRARVTRVLVVPALFDEANKLRRFTLSVMRLLDEAGIDSALPDWPGCHESLAALKDQSLASWRTAAQQICTEFKATHILSLRAGALVAPDTFPGWRYSPLDGAKLLSGLLRAQSIASREAGHAATREELLKRGRTSGLTLGGWSFGPEMLRELEHAAPAPSSIQSTIEQSQIGGSGLWLRAEPDDDQAQADALAAIVIEAVAPAQEPGA